MPLCVDCGCVRRYYFPFTSLLRSSSSLCGSLILSVVGVWIIYWSICCAVVLCGRQIHPKWVLRIIDMRKSDEKTIGKMVNQCIWERREDVDWWWLFLLEPNMVHYGNAEFMPRQHLHLVFLVFFFVHCLVAYVWQTGPSSLGSNLDLNIGNEDPFSEKLLLSGWHLSLQSSSTVDVRIGRVWQWRSRVHLSASSHSFELSFPMRCETGRERERARGHEKHISHNVDFCQ